MDGVPGTFVFEWNMNIGVVDGETALRIMGEVWKKG